MPDLLLQLFGSFHATYRGRPITHFRTAKVQALLAYLVTEGPRIHAREALMALLWPGLPPASAQNNLRQVVHQLRLAIPVVSAQNGKSSVPFILSGRRSVQVNPLADYEVDVVKFTPLMVAYNNHTHGDPLTCYCRHWLEEAVAMYKGVFLENLYLEDSNEFENWAHRRRAAYRCLAEDALSTLEEMHLRQGA